MLLEEGALYFRRCREAAGRKARHDLAQRRRMILGLEIVLDPLDAERGEIVAQARQRALVEKTGQIVRSVRQQFAASETDEQIEIFALDLGCGYRCSFGKGRVGAAKRRRIAAQLRDLLKQFVRRRAESKAASSAYSWARAASIGSTASSDTGGSL